MSDITIVVDCNDADFARDICAALQQFPDVTALLPHHQAARDAQYASCWFPNPQLLTLSLIHISQSLHHRDRGKNH